ncbi:hypothetical protein C8J57DRAFT_1382627 [Mycena rebaudengoi]|nr:hypothetical protein C8J57DRAFT_1382627 [Mycena rebaudengoi]
MFWLIIWPFTKCFPYSENIIPHLYIACLFVAFLRGMSTSPRMNLVLSSDLNTTLGALEIGVLVSCVLFGVTTVQVYIYYTRFPDDSRFLKGLVVFVWICETAHAVCLVDLLYTFTISYYALPELLLGAIPGPKSLPQQPFSLASLRLAYTASSRFGSMSLPRGCTFPASSGSWHLLLVGRIVICATSLRAASLQSYLMQWGWLLTTNWCISVACDFVITTTLVVVLHRRRSQALKKTAALMDKLIGWTIETGMLTSAASIFMLAFFVSMKDNFVWIAFYALGTRLFSNSLLASLNSREALRGMNQVSLSSLMPAIIPVSTSEQLMQVGRISYESGPSSSLHADKVPENV